MTDTFNHLKNLNKVRQLIQLIEQETHTNLNTFRNYLTPILSSNPQKLHRLLQGAKEILNK